jgi:Zn-dependent membrane protease YugP
MLGFFNPMYFVFLLPAILLMGWAQWRVKSAFARGMQVPSNLSGAAAAQHILESAGLHDVGIEITQGMLSDHYDARDRMLRLSPQVHESRTAAAVGIAAHEAGHALQHAQGYMPLVIRNAAVPAAQAVPTLFFVLLILGSIISKMGMGTFGIGLIGLGIAAYGAVLVFS